jgi:D-tyrosyl-tRNA(Tyr) deacylase
VAALRVFDDDDGRMNRSLVDMGGGALVVSQFTLYGDARKGRRPSYVAAAPPSQAAPLVEAVAKSLAGAGVPVASGRFGAEMRVESAGDGPVTILLDSARGF